MLKEFLEGFVELIGQTYHPEALQCTNSRKVDRFVTSNAIVEVPIDPEARTHKAGSLDSFAQLAVRGAVPSVWHSVDQVVAILDDGPASDLLDRVTWNLTRSEKFAALIGPAKEPKDQAKFVRFIEKYFREEIEAKNPGLLGDLRALKFRTVDDQTGNIQRGRESMGREIDAELTGADKLPELVLLTVPRWAELPITCTIKCRLNVDATERKLSLEPLGDEVNFAEIQCHAALGEVLVKALMDAGDGVFPVFHGSP